MNSGAVLNGFAIGNKPRTTITTYSVRSATIEGDTCKSRCPGRILEITNTLLPRFGQLHKDVRDAVRLPVQKEIKPLSSPFSCMTPSSLWSPSTFSSQATVFSIRDAELAVPGCGNRPEAAAQNLSLSLCFRHRTVIQNYFLNYCIQCIANRR
jgi:hypothetical protein